MGYNLTRDRMYRIRVCRQQIVNDRIALGDPSPFVEHICNRIERRKVDVFNRCPFCFQKGDIAVKCGLLDLVSKEFDGSRIRDTNAQWHRNGRQLLMHKWL